MLDRRRARRLLALLALLATAALSAPALAQDPFSDFFGGLFGRKSQPSQPFPTLGGEPRVRRIMPHRESKTPAYWHKSAEKPRKIVRKPDSAGAASAPAEDKTALPATPQTFFVATMGDTLGILLTNGLVASFEDRPDIGVIKKAKENSGLVRDDYFDWPKAAREIAAGPQKIDVAIIMIGSNDRQSIRRGAESFEPLSPQWRELYAARVDAVIAAFKEKNIPLVWVGLPVMKNEHFSADMQQLNEIFRDRAAHAGETYVDLWENLADEKGQFSAFGPDINGEIVKLRTSDGVHFTEAGARNAAHFVDAEVKKFREAHKAPAAAAPAAPGVKPATAPATPVAALPPGAPVVFQPPVSGPTAAPALPERPAIGPKQPLLSNGFDGDTALATRRPAATAADAASSQALVKHVLVDGGDVPARRNRADDSSWRAPPTQP